MFHPVTSFVSLVECVPASTYTFCSVSRSQFCIEVSSNNMDVFFASCRVLLDRLVHFLDVMVRISRVGEVHTHQFDALAVDHDCGGDGTFVDVFSSKILCLRFLFSMIPRPCFLSYFPAPMNIVFMMCLQYFCFVLPPRFTQ